MFIVEEVGKGSCTMYDTYQGNRTMAQYGNQTGLPIGGLMKKGRETIRDVQYTPALVRSKINKHRTVTVKRKKNRLVR